MAVRLYDAHNHLQDERLAPHLEAILPAVRREGVARMVVNGACEADWPNVLALAERHPEIIPSFGYHPWYVRECSETWQERLLYFLDQMPSGVGEIGLDRWVKGHDVARQQAVFRWQLRVAAERNRPVSIHCLQAWGDLLEILREGPLPSCGFLLHSYGGSVEMLKPLADLGAYFSFPGYFAHERKTRQRETFRHVPPDRLLVETDAPDQLPPEDRNAYPLTDPKTGKPINHPANLGAVYRFLAELRGEPLETMAEQVEENFRRLFAGQAGPA